MSETSERSRTRVAFRAALIASLLSAIGWPIELMIARQLPEARLWPGITASLASTALALLLVVRARRIELSHASYAFLANTAIVAAALWFSNAHYAVHAELWIPFQASKLGVLTVAILAPELWVGLLSIGIYAVAAVAQWYLFGAALHERTPIGEPWAMLAYAAFAAVLLVQSKRRFRIERELVRAQGEAEALAHLARSLIAVRDFANTPLQVLMLETDLLRFKHPELAPELVLSQRALDRLQHLSRLLAVHEARLGWRPGDEAFDPEQLLARLGPSG